MCFVPYFTENELKINTVKINESEIRSLVTDDLNPDSENVLAYYDGPLLFILKNKNNENKFIMYLTEINENKLVYQLIEKEEIEIEDYKAGSIKLPEFLYSDELQRKFKVTHNFKTDESGNEKCETIIEDLSEKESDEMKEYLNKPISVKSI